MSKVDMDDLITGILETVKIVALVGASNKPERPSYQVMKFLQKRGFTVIPINPGQADGEILGETVYASLEDAPAYDMVDIFRASDAAGDVVREAIRLADEKRTSVVWMQIGVTNDAAKAEAEAAGLVVIQNRCPKKEMERLGI
ncbi:CoA-binding protein [Magnetovibrio sp.]|uniref:CoA-binding protein n=1 Tax=Magnetovibrio sp. TaxID=2024836 RepID=UPI002F93922B